MSNTEVKRLLHEGYWIESTWYYSIVNTITNGTERIPLGMTMFRRLVKSNYVEHFDKRVELYLVHCYRLKK